MAEPGDAAPGILRAGVGDLQPEGSRSGFGHRNSRAHLCLW